MSMWTSEAVIPYSVRADVKQSAKWRYWASVKGLPTPVFLALAADVYADHLKRVHARLKRRRKARPAEDE